TEQAKPEPEKKLTVAELEAENARLRQELYEARKELPGKAVSFFAQRRHERKRFELLNGSEAQFRDHPDGQAVESVWVGLLRVGGRQAAGPVGGNSDVREPSLTPLRHARSPQEAHYEVVSGC